MGEIKYRIFLITGMLMGLTQLALKYIFVEGAWTIRLENIALSIIAAWIGERYAQRRLGIHLKWFGHGIRPIRPFSFSFLLRIGGLAFFVWLAVPGIFESKSILQFYANVGAIYLFAGAFFETCNLIKVGVKK